MALKQKNGLTENLNFLNILQFLILAQFPHIQAQSVISLGEQKNKKKRKKIEKKRQKFFILPTFFQGTELKLIPSHFS